jgi:hypothetical protein
MFVCLFKQQPKILDVGQCLPDSCTVQDVSQILINDPASQVLQQVVFINKNSTKANEIAILSTRTVPGEYTIWRDHKFYIFW